MKRPPLLLPLLALAAVPCFSQDPATNAAAAVVVPPQAKSVRLGDTTLGYQTAPDSIGFRFERNGQTATWRYPPESNAPVHFGNSSPESVTISTFENILGFRGFRIDFAEGISGFVWSEFHALDGDGLRLVAESWGGPGEHSEHTVDLDGDGVPELVCNVAYLMGGYRDVVFYRKENGRAMESVDISPLLPEPASAELGNRGRSARFDPATRTLRVRYLPESWNVEDVVDIDDSTFREVNLPVELDRLDWSPVVDADALSADEPHAERAERAVPEPHAESAENAAPAP